MKFQCSLFIILTLTLSCREENEEPGPYQLCVASLDLNHFYFDGSMSGSRIEYYVYASGVSGSNDALTNITFNKDGTFALSYKLNCTGAADTLLCDSIARAIGNKTLTASGPYTFTQQKVTVYIDKHKFDYTDLKGVCNMWLTSASDPEWKSIRGDFFVYCTSAPQLQGVMDIIVATDRYELRANFWTGY